MKFQGTHFRASMDAIIWTSETSDDKINPSNFREHISSQLWMQYGPLKNALEDNNPKTSEIA